MPVEATFAVVVGGAVAGAARLCPVDGPKRAVEGGVWIGRSHRGSGVGGAVLGLLVDRARTHGFEALLVSTTPDNAAVHRMLARLCVHPVRDGGSVTAWVDLTTAR
ncbi:GNAT family N-acetyltransferase [Streptomyces hypolithicus]